MKTIDGNILNIQKGIIVHQTNTLGIAGGGLALQIRNKYPEWFKNYVDYCQTDGEILGEISYFKINDNLYICNLFGQNSLGGFATKYEAYDKALPLIKSLSEKLNLPVYFPFMIGCGLGGGDWKVVEEKISNILPESIIVKFI